MDKSGTDRTNIFSEGDYEPSLIADPFSFSARNNRLRVEEQFKGPARQMKKTTLPKHPKILELEKLLAISELRYKTDLKRLKFVIGKSKKLSLLMVISLIARVRELFDTSYMYLFKVYFARWKANCQGDIPRKAVKNALRKIKLISLQKIARAFFVLRENVISMEIGKFERPSPVKVFQVEDKRQFKKTIKYKNQPRNKNVEKAMGKAYYR